MRRSHNIPAGSAGTCTAFLWAVATATTLVSFSCFCFLFLDGIHAYSGRPSNPRPSPKTINLDSDINTINTYKRRRTSFNSSSGSASLWSPSSRRGVLIATLTTIPLTSRNPLPAYAKATFAKKEPITATTSCRANARNCIRTTWIAPPSHSLSSTTSDLRELLAKYPSNGQNGVDCNGSKIVEDRLDVDERQGTGTARIEYYSCIGPAAVSMNLAKPFVDDGWLQLQPSDNSYQVEVRSASRIGASDYGVNKKRINYLAEQL